MASIDFDVYCSTCGHNLDRNVNINTNNRGVYIDIELCDNCEKTYQGQIDYLQQEIETLKETLENMEMFK